MVYAIQHLLLLVVVMLLMILVSVTVLFSTIPLTNLPNPQGAGYEVKVKN